MFFFHEYEDEKRLRIMLFVEQYYHDDTLSSSPALDGKMGKNRLEPKSTKCNSNGNNKYTT